ncbi:LysR substrate-binding domain-containing protein [Haliangium sp.]|uniref:LysR family transcriptional regulator n=1 Tax=Haliangium sp. TaxID=2663208 RepID=UPI003D133C6D
MALASTRFVEIFCTIVEAGNFTKAAKQLGITPAAVSRAVARHEDTLGVPLFRRSTRSVTLTDAGQLYFDQCRQALALIEGAERSLSEQQAAPRGLVRMSVPTTYGHYRVLPLVGDFLARYPEVSLELNVSHENVDFVTDRYDLAVRMGPLDDSALIARKLEDAEAGVFASPDYIERRGRPRHPRELTQHTCVTFARPSTGRPIPWGFRAQDGTPFEVAPGDQLRCTGDFLGCVTLARQGAGLVQAYWFLVEDDVRQGRLVEVLRPFAGRSMPFSLLQPAHPAQSLAVRLFADTLVEACAQRPQRPRRPGQSRGRAG